MNNDTVTLFSSGGAATVFAIASIWKESPELIVIGLVVGWGIYLYRAMKKDNILQDQLEQMRLQQIEMARQGERMEQMLKQNSEEHGKLIDSIQQITQRQVYQNGLQAGLRGGKNA